MFRTNRIPRLGDRRLGTFGYRNVGNAIGPRPPHGSGRLADDARPSRCVISKKHSSAILNGCSIPASLRLSHWPATSLARASTINYGLPDISAMGLNSASDNRRLRLAVEACLRNYEPRLTDVRVTLEKSDVAERRLRFHIEGSMKLDPAPRGNFLRHSSRADQRRVQGEISMREELLEYYERELAYVRQLGAEFAQKYPRVASRLLLEPDRCDDPHVERLIEAFAFMAARVHLRIDDDFPEITSALLASYRRTTCGLSLRCPIVECQLDPEQGKQTAGPPRSCRNAARYQAHLRRLALPLPHLVPRAPVALYRRRMRVAASRAPRAAHPRPRSGRCHPHAPRLRARRLLRQAADRQTHLPPHRRTERRPHALRAVLKELHGHLRPAIHSSAAAESYRLRPRSCAQSASKKMKRFCPIPGAPSRVIACCRSTSPSPKNSSSSSSAASMPSMKPAAKNRPRFSSTSRASIAPSASRTSKSVSPRAPCARMHAGHQPFRADRRADPGHAHPARIPDHPRCAPPGNDRNLLH